MSCYTDNIEKHQCQWNENHLGITEHGKCGRYERPWILPRKHWNLGLWKEIQKGGRYDDLESHLDKNHIQRHIYTNNLKSSWILCANLYFPFRSDTGKKLLKGFLEEKDIIPGIQEVSCVELEFIEEGADAHDLLGEPEGRRGAGQTSPDLAVKFSTKSGKGLLLIENKYTEHNFYCCSGRNKKYGHPDPSLCRNFKTILCDLKRNCYQMNWKNQDRENRKYWQYLKLTDFGKSLKMCPAATAGYQLFRQQALAEAIANSGVYSLVISCVACDEKNSTLKRCLRYSTGIRDFTVDWGKIFKGKAKFKTFTHQQWVSYVETHNEGEWVDWLQFVKERYCF